MNRAADRVRAHTAQEVLRGIDDATTASLMRHASLDSGAAVEQRMRQLEAEWDTDRAVEIEAATTGLLGLVLGTWLKPRFLVLPAFVAASMIVQAKTGRYPLMPLLRRLGLRTSREIQRERYALKALRGDFAGMDAEPALNDYEAAGGREPGGPRPPGVH